MMRLVELTGEQFGRLRVLRRAANRSSDAPGKIAKSARWHCLCDPDLGGCGTEVVVYGFVLTGGQTKSCGCLRAEMGREKLRNAAAKKANVVKKIQRWMKIHGITLEDLEDTP